MSDKTVQFGPFTPQELDSLASELKLKNIPFEIEKDEAPEKEFKANTGENLLTQTSWRQKQYMAQIFYVTLAKSDVARVADKIEQMGFSTAAPTDESFENMPTPSDVVAEDVFTKAKLDKVRFQRRLAAWLVIVAFLCLWTMAYIFA